MRMTRGCACYCGLIRLYCKGCPMGWRRGGFGASSSSLIIPVGSPSQKVTSRERLTRSLSGIRCWRTPKTKAHDMGEHGSPICCAMWAHGTYHCTESGAHRWELHLWPASLVAVSASTIGGSLGHVWLDITGLSKNVTDILAWLSWSFSSYRSLCRSCCSFVASCKSRRLPFLVLRMLLIRSVGAAPSVLDVTLTP